jgi:uncharacterized protein YjbI with pentapeptide repeats
MAGTQGRRAGLGSRFALCLLAAILTTALTASVVSAQDESQPVSAQPENQEIGRLFVHTAPRGSFKPIKCAQDRFRLRLYDVSPQVIWFEDHPGRHQGQIPVTGFDDAWASFGFRADPPNAALTLLEGDRSEDTIVVELGRPDFDRQEQTIRYDARKLGEASGNLSQFGSRTDGRISRRFQDASLFIDDSNAPVISGCVIQPYTSCVGIDLGADLSTGYFPDISGYDLSHADFYDAGFADVVMANANFTGANLGNAILGGAEAHNANFTGASLVTASLSATGLRSADLSNVDFTGAYMGYTDFSYADLRGAKIVDLDPEVGDVDPAADVSQADLTGATVSQAFVDHAWFCNTTMPNGSIRNDDCP